MKQQQQQGMFDELPMKNSKQTLIGDINARHKPWETKSNNYKKLMKE
jgi:hypothetical protein